MYRPTDIIEGFKGLLGWRQNYDPSVLAVADSLTESESGQYFQDFHPMLTLENLKAIAPLNAEVLAAPWLIGTAYAEGAKASFNGVNYRAKDANTGQIPDTSPAFWEVFSAFSKWVEEKTNASILKAVRAFHEAKLAGGSAKNVLESKALFNGAGRINDTVAATGSLVGFEIVPVRAGGVTLKINKIGLQMQGTGAITAYILHSSQTAPTHTITLSRTENGSMEWFSQSGLYLPYLSDGTDAGGAWYLVYDQTQAGANLAINSAKDWSRGPCSGCDFSEAAAYRTWSKYITVRPFKVAKTGAFDLTLWDIADNQYTDTINYGLNLQITLECDTTDLLVSNRNSFQNVLGLQMASDMLREFAYNPNFNIGRVQQNFNRMELLYELDGDSQSPKTTGLNHDLKQALKGLDIDAAKYSPVCFPCANKGLKYKAI